MRARTIRPTLCGRPLKARGGVDNHSEITRRNAAIAISAAAWWGVQQSQQLSTARRFHHKAVPGKNAIHCN